MIGLFSHDISNDRLEFNRIMWRIFICISYQPLGTSPPLLYTRFLNLITYHGHYDGHNGAEDIKEAVWQIGQSGYIEHGGLRHSAGVPRDKHAGYGGRILGGTAQKARLVTFLFVEVFKQTIGQDYG